MLFFSHVLLFLFYLPINAWCLAGSSLYKLTAWLCVTHGSQASFSTFNGSLKLAFSENKSKQVSFVLGLIDQAQRDKEGSLAVGIKVGASMCLCLHDCLCVYVQKHICVYWPRELKICPTFRLLFLLLAFSNFS